MKKVVRTVWIGALSGLAFLLFLERSQQGRAKTVDA